jgi:hypothetical protein
VAGQARLIAAGHAADIIAAPAAARKHPGIAEGELRDEGREGGQRPNVVLRRFDCAAMNGVPSVGGCAF